MLTYNSVFVEMELRSCTVRTAHTLSINVTKQLGQQHSSTFFQGGDTMPIITVESNGIRESNVRQTIDSASTVHSLVPRRDEYTSPLVGLYSRYVHDSAQLLLHIPSMSILGP